MKKTLLSVLILFSFLVCFSQNAREIVTKSSEAISLESLEMTATLKIYDSKGSERIRKVSNATKKFGNTVRIKIKFLSPADVKGTAILIYDNEDKDDEMWIYLPALRNTRRIVGSEKGRSFMGSEFTNADMSKPNSDDFTYKLLPGRTINGKDCWVVESVCKSAEKGEELGFSRKISYIDKKNYLAQIVEFYNNKNELFRKISYTDYRRQSDGSFFAFGMQALNLKNGRHSEMIVNSFRLGTNLKESDFSTFGLRE